MNRYENLASEIIDDVCEIVEEQHPEINLKNKLSKELGIEEPAVIIGNDYYNLEQEIAKKIQILEASL